MADLGFIKNAYSVYGVNPEDAAKEFRDFIQDNKSVGLTGLSEFFVCKYLLAYMDEAYRSGLSEGEDRGQENGYFLGYGDAISDFSNVNREEK